MPCIAVLNDDREFVDLLTRLLAEEGYRAFGELRRREAYEEIRRMRPDVVIINIHRGGKQQWPVLSRMPHDPATAQIPVIICLDNRYLLREDRQFLRERQCTVLEQFDFNLLLATVERIVGAPDADWA